MDDYDLLDDLLSGLGVTGLSGEEVLALLDLPRREGLDALRMLLVDEAVRELGLAL